MSTPIFKTKEEKLEYIKASINESSRLNLNRANNITLTTSLVKFDTPFLVSSSRTNKKTLEDLAENEENASNYLRNIINKGDGEKIDFTYSVKDALNKILPPKKITDKEQIWVQYAVCAPVTKAEVIYLQEKLDRRLQTELARETGICPIREQLYIECYDELMRQVTINCLERGILLKRIKKEFEITISSYQTLYESSIAYGIRVLILAEEDKKKIRENIEKCENDIEELEYQIKEIERLIEEHKENDSIERENKRIEHEEYINEEKKKAVAKKDKLREKLAFHNK